MNAMQIFNYNGSRISFEINGKIMINATEMAKPFCKKPYDWLRTDQATEIIQALSASKKCEATDLINVINGGNNFGTWMHEDVALLFAQWLSPEFYIWCNDRIKELLTTGKTSIKEVSRKELAQMIIDLENEKERLQVTTELQSKELKKVAPKVEYYEEVLQVDNCHTTTTIAKELGMTARALNHLLHVKGVHFFKDGHWILYAKYDGLGYTKTRTHKYETVEDGKMVKKTSIHTVWTEKGREFIHRKLNASLNQYTPKLAGIC